MKLTANSGFARGWAPWAAGLILILAFSAAVRYLFPVTNRGSHHADRTASASVNSAPATSASRNHSDIRSYFMDFAGDHSLDLATVIEQSSAGNTRYTIQLHLASGAEQSVELSAPPGGLQVEMHDMTGDKVQNDVVLRPALLRWLPTVLVNDGHDHFAVLVSGTDPRYFSSSVDLESRRRDSQMFAFLMSSGFKTAHLIHTRRRLEPQLQDCLSYSFTQASANRLGHKASPGRAPPVIAI
jgi:hypothetical protein